MKTIPFEIAKSEATTGHTSAVMSLPPVTRRSMTPEPLEFHPIAGLAEHCTRTISASTTVQGLTILALVLGAAGSAYSLVNY